MRPTDIKLKTPRDQTPGPKYYFNVTASGKDLSYSKKYKNKKSFSTEKRFKNYENLAKRTSESVGPGSYIRDQFSVIKSTLTRSTVKYLPTIKKNDSQNSYYFVGNLLVKDENSNKKKVKINKNRIRTVSRHNLHNSFEQKFKYR